MLELMNVTEHVTRTGETRTIDHLMADGIIHGAETGGYVIDRMWSGGYFTASIYRPGASEPMLIYTVSTE